MKIFKNARRRTRFIMEAYLPKPISSAIGFVYPLSLFYPRFKQQRRQKKYEAASVKLGPNKVLFSGLHDLKVTTEAKNSYEHFCWRDERMVIEINNL